jgi:hypothetical protein
MESEPELIVQNEIIDQAVALSFDIDQRTVEVVTQIRIKISNPNDHEIRLNLKQAELTNFRIHSVQLYNKTKDKLKRSTLDHKLQSSIQYASPSELYEFYTKMFAETPHNVYNFEEACQKMTEWEDRGHVVINWWFNESDKYNREMGNIYRKGFGLYFTIELKTKLTEPVGPVFFQKAENKIYFIKNCTFGSCRNLFPCQDQMFSWYHFSKIKISINDPKMVAICSGNLEETMRSSTHVTYTFGINKKLNPTFIGITVGEYFSYDSPTFVGRVFSVQEEKDNPDFDDILYNLKKYEKYLFSFGDEEINLVLFPGLNYIDLTKIQENRFYNPLSPYFFQNFFMINTEFFLVNKYLESNFSNIAIFLKYKFLSKAVEFTHFTDQNSLWILTGISSFIDDVMAHHVNGQADILYFLNEKKERYFEMVQTGQERYRLTLPHFFSPNQIYSDKGFCLKSNLAFICIAGFLKLKIDNYSSLFAIFNKENELSTFSFLKSLKTVYRIKNLKRQISSIIDQTGYIRLDLNYFFNRKDNKLYINIKQIPLLQTYFINSNKKRLAIEKFFNFVSEGNKLVEKIQTGFRVHIDNSKGLLNEKVISEADSVVLANAARFPIKFWSFNLPVIVIECSSEGCKEDIYNLDLNDKEISTAIQLKARFRRNINKKNIGDGASITDINAIQSIGQEGQNDNIGETSVYGSEIQNSIYYEGGESSSFKLLIDPYNCFLFQVHSNESESVLFDQLDKGIKERSDLTNLMSILSALNRILNGDIISKFCSMLSKKEIPIYLKLKILQILEQNREDFLIGRVPDVLIHLIKSIKYDDDGTLRPNIFKEYPNFFYFLNLIKVLLKYDKSLKNISRSKEPVPNDDSIVLVILTLIKKNDNSINPNDDAYYQGFIIRCLLKCLNSRYFDKICKEILRYIKTEHYNKPRNKYIICTIFLFFARFVTRNMKLLHYTLQKLHSNKFSLLEIFAENQNLKLILEYFQNLKKTYKGNTIVAAAIFRHKLFVKKSIKGYKTADILIYAMKYIRKMGARFGSITEQILVAEFYKYVMKNKDRVEKLQMNLNLKNIDLLAQMIWGQMNCGMALVDPIFRHWFFKIYEAIFDEYVPICYFEKERNVLFPIDTYWLEVTKRVNFEKYFTKEKKFISFKYLSLQKKTKKGQIISPPQNFKYNIRDIILQNFKVNKETLTKRNMMKHIVNILLTEKIIMKIENDFLKSEQLSPQEEKGEFTFKLKNNVYSIKDIKRRLIKPEINTLGRLKQEIFTVIDYFNSKNFINEGVYKEYVNFVALLISEAQKILKEKLEKEEAQNENMKIKLPLRRT